MTTVSQLEKELNVSRVSLYAILKKDWVSAHVSEGERGVLLVDDAGVNILKTYYAKKNRVGAPRKNVMAEIIEGIENINEGDVSTVSGVIGILQEQLVQKDEQINQLLNIVSNQQQLHA